MKRQGLLYLLALVALSCSQPSKDTTSRDAEWLTGTGEEKFHTVSRHLRGFDMAMMETGHRYAELYWAARDQNWLFAKYQAEKIRLAIANGLERRPKRAASANTFLTFVLPEVLAAVEKQDSSLFWNRFGALTSTCNACHEAEKVAFVNIAPPEERVSPVRIVR